MELTTFLNEWGLSIVIITIAVIILMTAICAKIATKIVLETIDQHNKKNETKKGPKEITYLI